MQVPFEIAPEPCGQSSELVKSFWHWAGEAFARLWHLIVALAPVSATYYACMQEGGDAMTDSQCQGNEEDGRGRPQSDSREPDGKKELATQCPSPGGP